MIYAKGKDAQNGTHLESKLSGIKKWPALRRLSNDVEVQVMCDVVQSKGNDLLKRGQAGISNVNFDFTAAPQAVLEVIITVSR